MIPAYGRRKTKAMSPPEKDRKVLQDIKEYFGLKENDGIPIELSQEYINKTQAA